MSPSDVANDYELNSWMMQLKACLPSVPFLQVSLCCKGIGLCLPNSILCRIAPGTELSGGHISHRTFFFNRVVLKCQLAYMRWTRMHCIHHALIAMLCNFDQLGSGVHKPRAVWGLFVNAIHSVCSNSRGLPVENVQCMLFYI